MAAYATAAELRSQIKKESTASDNDLGIILNAATRAIDGFCNRPEGFLAAAEASVRVFPGDGSPVCWVDECVQITAVAVKTSANESTYAAWAAGDWLAGQGHPVERPIFNKTPYTFITVLPTGAQTSFLSGRLGGYSVPTVQVTARWGHADAGDIIADLLKEACIAQAARWYSRIKSGWSDAQATPEFGILLFRKSLDPDIQMMLQGANLVKGVI